jgi:hypothetical protein
MFFLLVNVSPVFAAPTSSLDVFPKLPQSKFCDKNSLLGVWKLLMVYEVPSGKEIALYMNRPLQYAMFEPDSRYGEYISSLRAISANGVRNVAFAQKSNQQYVIGDSGVIFFYKNSLPTDSLVCFIVARNEEPFETGQMLLMPPEKAAKNGRMVKVYQKVSLEKEQENY